VIERDGDMPVRLSITEQRRGKARVRVGVTVEAERVSDALVALMASRVARMLCADNDLRGFHALAARTKSLKPVVALGAGRILRSVSMTENIIKAICGTNVDWRQAVKMINRIGQLGPCLGEFRSLHAWPTPKEILRAGDDYLRQVARVGYRAESILELCRSVEDGSFDPESLERLARSDGSDELFKRLRGIKGIGPATAAFLMGQLGRHDRVSVDSWTLTYVGRTYLNGKKPTVRQVEDIYERYGEWRGLVWWFEQWLQWDTARTMLRELNHRGRGR
jgi:3-methyladenine DNA glycosylase/8-oxoguanine DNA glycosylase